MKRPPPPLLKGKGKGKDDGKGESIPDQDEEPKSESDRLFLAGLAREKEQKDDGKGESIPNQDEDVPGMARAYVEALEWSEALERAQAQAEERDRLG